MNTKSIYVVNIHFRTSCVFFTTKLLYINLRLYVVHLTQFCPRLKLSFWYGFWLSKAITVDIWMYVYILLWYITTSGKFVGWRLLKRLKPRLFEPVISQKSSVNWLSRFHKVHKSFSFFFYKLYRLFSYLNGFTLVISWAIHDCCSVRANVPFRKPYLDL